jgi:5-methyltetrahydrofolate--homocysteine methyltransferase
VVDLNDLKAAVVEGNAKRAEALTHEALAAGHRPGTLIAQALTPGMDEVGERFKAGDYYVPEMLLAARAMRTSLGILKPLLTDADAARGPRVVVGTVQGDLHDIGKSLVGMMLEGAGFEVIDLGANVSPEQFVRTVAEQNVRVVALSALLTTTMTNMPATIEALRAANLRDGVVVIVGGAPVTERYARQIGADGFAPDAASAVDVVKELVYAKVS